MDLEQVLLIIITKLPGWLLLQKICRLKRTISEFVKKEMKIRWKRYHVWFADILCTVDAVQNIVHRIMQEEILLQYAEKCTRSKFNELWKTYDNTDNEKDNVEALAALRTEAERHWCALFFSTARINWLWSNECVVGDLVCFEQTGKHWTKKKQEEVETLSCISLRYFLRELFMYRANACTSCNSSIARPIHTAITAHICDGMEMTRLLIDVGIRADYGGPTQPHRRKCRQDLLMERLAHFKVSPKDVSPRAFGEVAADIFLINNHVLDLLELG